jgi:predicted amidophosphoribosyltransferase
MGSRFARERRFNYADALADMLCAWLEKLA